MMKKNKQRGNRLGFLIFELYLALGVKHAYALLYFVCLHYLLFDFRLKKASLKYILLRFSGTGFFKRYFHLYRLYINTGKNLIDLRQLQLRPEKVLFKCDDDYIIKVLDEGRGLLMLSSHTGNWQVMMKKLPDFKVRKNVVMQLQGFDELNKFLAIENGDKEGINIIDSEKGMETSLEILSELKNGNLVSIMADRTITSAKNISVKFFNNTVSLPLGPFLIAASAGAPIVQLIPYRNDTCSYKLEIYRISIPDSGKKKDKIQMIAEEYIHNIETFLTRHPYEWNATSLNAT